MNNKENIIIANYGNGSIALIQWAIENKLPNLTVISVDTGWSSEAWHNRYILAFQFLNTNNISYKHLVAPKNFTDLVIDRGEFPSPKFQWCAPFLKGLVINDALDSLDPLYQATIHLSKLRCVSRANHHLKSGLESDNYQERIINYPLLDHTIDERDLLINNAGFNVLSHNSEECLPCIHSNTSDLKRMSKQDNKRLSDLESKLNKRMLQIDSNTKSGEKYDMGCGNLWGCGD